MRKIILLTVVYVFFFSSISQSFDFECNESLIFFLIEEHDSCNLSESDYLSDIFSDYSYYGFNKCSCVKKDPSFVIYNEMIDNYKKTNLDSYGDFTASLIEINLNSDGENRNIEFTKNNIGKYYLIKDCSSYIGPVNILDEVGRKISISVFEKKSH